MPSRFLIPFAFAICLSPAAANAADRPVVVELFTSQGCSSCPPANAYLNDLARDRSDVLALAFHVTYWDRLGWKDPFSMEAATERQDRYGHKLRRRLLHAGDRHRRRLEPCRLGPRRSRPGDRRRRNGRAGPQQASASPKQGDRLTIDVAERQRQRQGSAGRLRPRP